MTELILNTNVLPEPLFRLIHTERVRINEVNGVINLVPIMDIINDCPLRGLAVGSSLTVDKILAITHDEKEMKE